MIVDDLPYLCLKVLSKKLNAYSIVLLNISSECLNFIEFAGLYKMNIHKLAHVNLWLRVLHFLNRKIQQVQSYRAVFSAIKTQCNFFNSKIQLRKAFDIPELLNGFT